VSWDVLVGCEVSGVIRDAFRALGHEAYSCDLKPSSSPYHIQGDIRELADRRWRLAILHPDCRYLAVSGAHLFNKPGRRELQREAIDFFMWCVNFPADMVAVENPISIMSTVYRKPDQYIQPYQFGDDASKNTCLWLLNLPPLEINPADYVQPRIVNGKKRWANQTDSGQNRLGPSPTRAADRAQTYPGPAKAMAIQWGNLLRAALNPTAQEEKPRLEQSPE